MHRKRLERAVRFGSEEAVVVIAREIPWRQGLRREWQSLSRAVGRSANQFNISVGLATCIKRRMFIPFNSKIPLLRMNPAGRMR